MAIQNQDVNLGGGGSYNKSKTVFKNVQFWWHSSFSNSLSFIGHFITQIYLVINDKTMGICQCYSLWKLVVLCSCLIWWWRDLRRQGQDLYLHNGARLNLNTCILCQQADKHTRRQVNWNVLGNYDFHYTPLLKISIWSWFEESNQSDQ